MAVCRAHQPTLLRPPAPAGVSEQTGWRLCGFVMTALRLAWLPGPKSMWSAAMYTHPSRNPSVGHRARMVGPTRDGPPAQPVGETHVGLACPVPLGSSQFAYSLALCILPHPRPSAGASTPPRGTVPLQHRFSCSHPCATLPPTHQHPHHRLCTTQYPHSPGLARESSKAWTQALQPPRPACPPQDMHLQVRTWLCSPWCTFQGHPHSHISPHSHAVLPARFCPHKLSLTLSPHLLRPQSAPASPQHLCIQPRVCGHCLGFPRSGCDPPVPPGH